MHYIHWHIQHFFKKSLFYCSRAAIPTQQLPTSYSNNTCELLQTLGVVSLVPRPPHSLGCHWSSSLLCAAPECPPVVGYTGMQRMSGRHELLGFTQPRSQPPSLSFPAPGNERPGFGARKAWVRGKEGLGSGLLTCAEITARLYC